VTADASVANHDDGVADVQDRWCISPILSRRPEHILDELNQMLCLVNDDTRSHGVPTFGSEVITVSRFVHRASWEREPDDTELLNHLGDVNLGIQHLAEFAFVVTLQQLKNVVVHRRWRFEPAEIFSTRHLYRETDNRSK